MLSNKTDKGCGFPAFPLKDIEMAPQYSTLSVSQILSKVSISDNTTLLSNFTKISRWDGKLLEDDSYKNGQTDWQINCQHKLLSSRNQLNNKHQYEKRIFDVHIPESSLSLHIISPTKKTRKTEEIP